MKPLTCLFTLVALLLSGCVVKNSTILACAAACGEPPYSVTYDRCQCVAPCTETDEATDAP
ncbi:unnamed protein product [marine sediment metagenome]|uniref:Uncharacterized protein n=1 Tax=marine sediment metagenome TaxID=412755 RepID=X0WKN3_9ZZZZ